MKILIFFLVCIISLNINAQDTQIRLENNTDCSAQFDVAEYNSGTCVYSGFQTRVVAPNSQITLAADQGNQFVSAKVIFESNISEVANVECDTMSGYCSYSGFFSLTETDYRTISSGTCSGNYTISYKCNANSSDLAVVQITPY